MRILITGSRWWTEHHIVRETIVKAYGDGNETLYVRHGDCCSGADAIAHSVVNKLIAQGWDIVEERRPAEWQHDNCGHRRGRRRNGDWYCKAAGALRNQAMIDEGGIDEVHAFPLPGGSGTGDCVRRASAADLVITNHGYPKVTMEDMLLRRVSGR